MKNSLLLLIACALFYSCSKHEEQKEIEIGKAESVVQKQEFYIGKWKLMSAYFAFFPAEVLIPVIDFSECNIVFEFKPDGVLVVTGKMDNHPDANAGFEKNILYIGEGTHSYSITGQETAHMFYLRIDDNDFDYSSLVGEESISLDMIGIGGLEFKSVK